MAPELISVVIPTRNRGARLQRALDSALAQRWPALEVIVVDDASTDETPALLQAAAAKDARVRYLRNARPLGGGGARNEGIAAARGAFVAFLDDDDEWLPEKLERQHARFAAQGGAAAVSCSFYLCLPNKADRVLSVRPPADLQQLLYANCLGGATVCFAPLARVREVGGFDPGLRSGQDWDLWLKLASRGPVLVCEEPLARHVVHAGQRITGQTGGEYQGRRRIHFRYRARMSSDTRRHSLCELGFFRHVLFRRGWPARLTGLAWLVARARGADRLRFPYRLLKMSLSRRLEVLR